MEVKGQISMIKPIGTELSPMLIEIEDLIWDFEYDNPKEQGKYSKEGFRGAIKIFMSALLDKMWDFQEENKISQEDRIKKAEEAGQIVRLFIKSYTGIDSIDLYKNK